jgi:hypothetical protein
LLERVDHKDACRPIDGDNACDFLSSRVPVQVHLPVATVVQKRPFRWRALLHAEFDLAPRNSSSASLFPAVGDYDDIPGVLCQYANDSQGVGARQGFWLLQRDFTLP